MGELVASSYLDQDESVRVVQRLCTPLVWRAYSGSEVSDGDVEGDQKGAKPESAFVRLVYFGP